MTNATLIAVDWGTTNRRVYVLGREGSILATERDDLGVVAMVGRDFADEIERLRDVHGDIPVICAGMVGSQRGWVEVPYLPCPAGADAIGRALHWVEPRRTAIVPGLFTIAGRKGDVMRGEEVQLLGAVHAGLVPAQSLLCQPGTHCKWARIVDGKVDSFRTTVTGELFALLRKHSLLADVIKGEVAIGAAFREGIADADQPHLLGDLFRVRASGLLDLRPDAEGASYTSGLLIGSDVREQELGPEDEVFILADPVLGALYGEALHARGIGFHLVDSHAAFVAGITKIWECAHE